MNRWLTWPAVLAGTLVAGPALAQDGKEPTPAPGPPETAGHGPATTAAPATDDTVSDPCEAVRQRYIAQQLGWESRLPSVLPAPREAFRETLPRRLAQLDEESRREWSGFDRLGAGLLALVPHPGVMVRGQAHVTVSWPLSYAFGAPVACRLSTDIFAAPVARFRPHRVLLEPGLTPGDDRGLFWVRLGYRLLWHPASSSVGFGLGLGTTLHPASLRERGPSLSPEAVVQLGSCCHGFFTLAARYDRTFRGKQGDEVSLNLGFSYD